MQKRYLLPAILALLQGNLAQSGELEWHKWINIAGDQVGPSFTHTSAYAFPARVEDQSTVTSAASPADTGDHFGGRLRGTITAPVTGAYTFWIAGDNNCELWLGEEGGVDSRFTKRLIAKIEGPDYWTGYQQWDKYPTQQQSVTINLVANEKYWMEAFVKEQTGGDHVEVAWEYTGQTRQIIPGTYLTLPTAHPNDTDEDGLPDDWQDDYGFAVYGCFGDTDRDGDNNLKEYQDDTNPTDTDRPNTLEWTAWFNINGTSVSAITHIDDVEFWEDAGDSDYVTSAEAPENVADNFAERLRGRVIAPVTGNYTFYISSRHNGELWLGTSESRFTKRLVASVNGETNVDEWDKYASQESVVISLVANQEYWIEAWAKNSDGDDHLQIGWKHSSMTAPELIPNTYLSPPGVDPLDMDDTGLPDVWQNLYAVDNPFLDEDEDGYSNLEEYRNQTNPTIKGALEWSVWNNVDGTALANLTRTERFLNSPSSTIAINGSASPVSFADNYGARLRGTITAPVTGNYTFWIASDDNGELWISENQSQLYKYLRASVPGWTGVQQWNTYTSQQSIPLTLVSGQKYWIEALVKEGGGGDHLEIAWAYEGTGVDDGKDQTLQLIPSRYLGLPQYDPEDKDGDGLPDAWQTLYNVHGAFGDYDLDGVINLNEYRNNTDPTNAVVGYLSRDIWYGIGGELVQQLTYNPFFLQLTDYSELWAGASYPTVNKTDGYGQRFRGTITPPTTGDYTFWVAGDNNSELWLSTNEYKFQKRKIAHLTTLVSQIPPISGGAISVNNFSAQDPNQNGGYNYYSGWSYGWNFNGGGIASNGGPWYGPNAPAGNQALFIQSGDISNEVTMPADGTYSISFQAVGRNGEWGPAGVKLEVDGNIVLEKTAAEVGQSSWQTYTVSDIELTAGIHTIKFIRNNTIGGDKSVAIDNVQITGTEFEHIQFSGYNSGAEQPNQGGGNFNYYSGDTYGWNFNGGGIAYNNSPWFGPNAPEGNQAFFMQSGTLTQNVTAPLEGFYNFTFKAVGRGGQYGPAGVQVEIDGGIFLTLSADQISQSEWKTYTIPSLHLTAGNHVVKFIHNNTLGGDKSIAIDDPKFDNATSVVSVGTVDYGNFDYFPTQKSAPITLQANSKYFIEVLHKEDGENEHVEVAWQKPGGQREIIPSQYLTSFDRTSYEYALYNDWDDDYLPYEWEGLNNLSHLDNGRFQYKNGALGDPDFDGLTNREEYMAGTNPWDGDTDEDGLSDYLEVAVYKTDPNDSDYDGDGMYDGWEALHGLNPYYDDEDLDSDGDGLTNVQEYQAGSDPWNWTTDKDSDGDIIPDGWETMTGTNPAVDNSQEDQDGDGMGRTLEHLTGRDPTVADSPVDTSDRQLDVHTTFLF